ncbi:hypothetical protein DFH27DRAFT_616222 [Peziza echinospora]|nr:hypothetical protein DFH27DRAFT_616222 [Peziza echinospora]
MDQLRGVALLHFYQGRSVCGLEPKTKGDNDAISPEAVTIESDEDEPPKRRERAKKTPPERAKLVPKRKEVVEAGPSKKKAKMKSKDCPTSIHEMREALHELMDKL